MPGRASRPGTELPGQAMNPAAYQASYATARGRWIGEAEYALAARQLAVQPSDRLLDIGEKAG
jgi:hypothetical protein